MVCDGGEGGKLDLKAKLAQLTDWRDKITYVSGQRFQLDN